jgi:predicted phage terminase large subunit-like protein
MRLAEDLGESEDWLRDVANEMEIEDGVIWVYGVGEDGVQQQLHRASIVLIEDKASGTQLIQELISEGFYGVKRYKPELDKVMRMHAQTAIIENGFVYLPKEAPWLPAYLHELATFPMGRHDDQVDSTSQFLDWFKLSSQVQPTRYVHINWMGR